MCMRLHKRYTIRDLRSFLEKNQSIIDANLYKNCSVLIIDDQVQESCYPFSDSIRLLRENYSCQISVKRDLDSLSDAAGYNVIICDHIGIGKTIFGTTGTGIKLIKELISRYPEKLYVLFSNGKFPLRGLQDLSIDKWDKQDMIDANERNEDAFSDRIKQSIRNCADPVYRWSQIRLGLLQKDMSIFDVAELESSYVSSIMTKNETTFVKKTNSLSPVSETVNAYLQTAVSVIGLLINLLAL